MRCIGETMARRRRGQELIGAILDATLIELSEHGYEGLTIEHVAERAGVGKASIYRRWPGRLELVLDALDTALPALSDLPDTGSIRGDLIELLRIVAATMNGPCGAVMHPAYGEHDELYAAVKDRLMGPRRAALVDLHRRAVERREIRDDATRPYICEVGPMLLHAELLRDGRISDRGIVRLVDEVLLPMLRPDPVQSPPVSSGRPPVRRKVAARS